jgi:hypothetical protein
MLAMAGTGQGLIAVLIILLLVLISHVLVVYLVWPA